MKLRTAYSKPIRVSHRNFGHSLTKQSHRVECDINHLLAKYQKTGLLSHVNRFKGDYSDITSVPDYHASMNIVLAADDAFASLPSSIRKRFNNSPADFVNFVSDPNNQEEIYKLGLAEKPPVPPSQSASASDPKAEHNTEVTPPHTSEE